MKPFSVTSIAFSAIVLASFTASVLIAGRVLDGETTFASAPRSRTLATARPESATVPPSAAAFERDFVRLTNTFADEHGDPARIGQAECVQASPGRYMCSYAVTRRGAPSECRLMQARWTPDEASTFEVTLAGRTSRCGSLRDAISSLQGGVSAQRPRMREGT